MSSKFNLPWISLSLVLSPTILFSEEPEIVSTLTTIEAQQNDRERPSYKQPKELAEPAQPTTLPLQIEEGETIVFLGNSLSQRMEHFGYFETLLHKSFPDKKIAFRNMGFPGHTPSFRPEAGNPDPWAFEGGKKFRPEILKHHGIGHYPKPDEWLTILKADTIVAFFGFNESFDGPDRVKNFQSELAAFADHTLSRSYNGKEAPRLVLATPVAMEQHPAFHLPDAEERNAVIALYADAVAAVAREKKIGFIDLFTPSREWYAQAQEEPLTLNGVHLDEQGYRTLAPFLVNSLFEKSSSYDSSDSLLKQAVYQKNWMWRNDYRVLNGVHVYGQRWAPFGNVNYPEEIEKIRQMTVLRDRKIWEIAQGETDSLVVDDSITRKLSPITTNYKADEESNSSSYVDEKTALEKFTLPEGYEVSVFASEADFPNLGNPAQMRFDTKGRLWVSTVPSYPHYKPGGPLPNDKLLIYEDTNGDGRADKETIFAEELHTPIGFDFANDGGVYVSEEPFLTIHYDLDGDDRADKKHYLLDGFDSHDTHHAICSFDTDHGGGLFLPEGRFLHSQVETPWGPQRMTDGGVWRFDPKSWKVERVLQTDVSNPWGVAHDEYGQNILNDASGGTQLWMAGYSIKMPHSREMKKVGVFNYEHKVRPTSGSEFLHSRHFPDEVQGDYLVANTIGFLGIKQYDVLDDGPEMKGKHRQNLIQSSDGNFRPCDLEVAPDGSLYFIDWHNTLIGHMQHSARDPLRNSEYGRIYRITYPKRPLVEAPEIRGASLEHLFENLKLPELNARKRSHQELRLRSSDEVIAAAKTFAQKNESDERLVLEALWATWGQGKPDRELLQECLQAKDFRVASGATRVLRHSLHLFEDASSLLTSSAQHEHPRVRLEALSAASWLGGEEGAQLLLEVASKPTGKWINNALNSAMELMSSDVEALLSQKDYPLTVKLEKLKSRRLPAVATHKSYRTKQSKKKMSGALYNEGWNVFMKEGSCVTCHLETGKGVAEVYPPLVDSIWVTGDKERLIKLTLHGLFGEIEVNGVKYGPPKSPPMSPLGGMFNDQEIAAVLNYVRMSWGNNASVITPEEVKEVREKYKTRTDFWSPDELLRDHPIEE